MRPMNIKKKAQNVVEYAFVVAIVSSAAIAMTVYVYRAIQSQQKAIVDEFVNE